MRSSRIKYFLIRSGLFFIAAVLPIFTFTLGIIGTLLWQEFISPPTVSLCQLARTPHFYTGRIVRVEADASGGFGAVFIYDKSCDLKDTAAASSVWKDEDLEPDLDIRKLYSESESETYQARILVTGRFDPNATRGCYVPKFAVKATKIELKSEIKTELIEKRKK